MLDQHHKDELIDLRVQGYTYKQISEHFMDEYNIHISTENVGATYRYSTKESKGKHTNLSYIESHKNKKKNTELRKKERILLDNQVVNIDVLKDIKKMLKTLEIPPITYQPEKLISSVKNATIVLSDLHFGLKTKSFNKEIAEKRFKEICHHFIKKCERDKPREIIIAALGDFIHGTSMHKGQEFTVDMQLGEQVSFAIRVFWQHLYIPIIKLGIPVKTIVIAGNHDRPTKEKQANDIGDAYLSNPMFTTIEMLCENYSHMNFHIEKGVFHVYKHCCYVHGDFSRGILSRKGQVSEMQTRQKAARERVDRLIHGHFHSAIITNNGEVISNGTLATDDHFATALGFECDRAMQGYRFEYDNGHVESGFFTAA